MDERSLCSICLVNVSKYTCPKCSVVYCSSDCYKSPQHLECSEYFYHNCILTEMNAEDDDATSRQKMLEILEKYHNQEDEESTDSDDDHEYEDLETRLFNVNFDDADLLWDSLTDDEKKEFESLLLSDGLSKIIPVWIPWWHYRAVNGLIQVVGENHPKSYMDACPKLMSNIKPFNEISNKNPASCVKYNIINALSAYVCIVRYFNGEHFDFPKIIAYLLVDLSKNLSTNANFESYTLAVESAFQQSLQNNWITTHSDTIYEDVKNILNGPDDENKNYYIKSALSDMHEMLQAAKQPKKIEAGKFHHKFKEIEIPPEEEISKSKINALLKKIEYFISYVETYSSEICSAV